MSLAVSHMRTPAMILGVAAALLLTTVRSVDAQQKHPAEEKGAKALKTEFTSSLRFVNGEAKTVKVYWLDYEGKRVLLGLLQPGDAYEIAKAALNHPYVVTDEKDNALGLYYADAQPRTVAVGAALAKQPKFGGNGGFPGTTFFKSTPSLLKGLQNTLVQEEIKLDKDQQNKLAELVKKDTEARAALQNVPGIDTTAKLAALTRDNDLLAQALLTAAQATRIEQIKRQHPIAAVWSNTELLQALKLSPQQQAQFDGLRDEASTQVKAASPAGGGGLNFEQYQKRLVDIRTALHGKAQTVLDPAQKKVWLDIVGEPCKSYLPATVFNLPTSSSKFKSGGGRGSKLQPGFGSGVIPTARFLNEKSVQAELKLTPEQTKRVDDLLGTGLRAATTALPADLLTPAQLQRARGIYLQQHMRAFGPAGPFRWKEVLEQLNLSDEQKQQLTTIGSDDARALADLIGAGNPVDTQKVRDLDKATQDKLDRVLSAEQKTKLRDIIGPQFQGPINAPYRSSVSASVTRQGWGQAAAVKD